MHGNGLQNVQIRNAGNLNSIAGIIGCEIQVVWPMLRRFSLPKRCQAGHKQVTAAECCVVNAHVMLKSDERKPKSILQLCARTQQGCRPAKTPILPHFCAQMPSLPSHSNICSQLPGSSRLDLHYAEHRVAMHHAGITPALLGCGA